MKTTRFSFLHRSRCVLAALAGLWLAQTAQAGDWWKPEWTSRKKITVDTTTTGVAIAEPIGTAAVLLRLHGGNFPFDRCREDGSDIRFVGADNKTILPHHIEKYDALMGEAFVWVKIADLTPKAQTSFWMYFSNASNTMEPGTDVKGTFDADTVLVYHFTEQGAPPVDSSSNGNNAQTAGLATAGSFIGSGVLLNEKHTVVIPSSPSLGWAAGAPATLTAWVKLSALAANTPIISRGTGDLTNLVVGVENGVPYLELVRGTDVQRQAATGPLAVNTWRHLAVVANPTTITLYLDGEEAAKLNTPLPAMNSPLQLGGGEFKGELDELAIAKVARPAGYIKLAALGQGEKGAKLAAMGTDEVQESWLSGGYIGIILKSLTVDGWVAIIILAIMGLISWWVMIGKGLYLGRVAKGNETFIKAWRQVASDLSVLGHADEEHIKTMGGRIDQKSYQIIRHAPIYRIYAIGLEELRGRFAADERSQGAQSLSAQSVEAIRSVLDAGLVRENQRLTNKMVLLTIAISGGPFIGLLGTVAGVMITFAGVAQQGEVNVPGIAPGISAALLATVAGLAVAIPSLFGYNYLLTRIKNAQSDQQVFVDEFVTKVAESFSGENESHALPGKFSAPMTQPKPPATMPVTQH
jgi:biopolymer transport protein ExbB